MLLLIVFVLRHLNFIANLFPTLHSNTQDGRKLFMSRKTYNELSKRSEVVVPQESKSDLEVVLSFDHFPSSKTAVNIAAWLRSGHVRGGLRPEYIMSHSTDGASNAVASAEHFEAVTDAVRESSISHYTCLAHQVNRAAKFATGTGDFKSNENLELSEVIRKMHEINGRIYRNEKRLKVLFQVQKERNRYVSVFAFC